MNTEALIKATLTTPATDIECEFKAEIQLVVPTGRVTSWDRRELSWYRILSWAAGPVKAPNRQRVSVLPVGSTLKSSQTKVGWLAQKLAEDRWSIYRVSDAETAMVADSVKLGELLGGVEFVEGMVAKDANL